MKTELRSLRWLALLVLVFSTALAWSQLVDKTQSPNTAGAGVERVSG